MACGAGCAAAAAWLAAGAGGAAGGPAHLMKWPFESRQAAALAAAGAAITAMTDIAIASFFMAFPARPVFRREGMRPAAFEGNWSEEIVPDASHSISATRQSWDR